MARLSSSILRRLGVRALRPGQREVIERVLQGRDVLAVMPTGAGKSLCYQLPALQLKGTTVVVSPLISLMKDQADKLARRGIDAAALNSALPASDLEAALRDLRAGRAEIVFATPERLADPGFLADLKRNAIDLMVVDEAHCISQWGHDFRPAYRALASAARALGDPPLLALTATATPEVAEDIRRQLGRPAMEMVNTGLYRPNLRFAVRQLTGEEAKLAALREALRTLEGAGIVYTATVRSAEAVHARLEAAGVAAALYHGRLPARERDRRQEAFMSGRARVMVATNAFGVGIDKRNIRFVVHYEVPGSLEAYYQEAGRAGRDGAAADCLLLYDHDDRRVHLYFAGGKGRARSAAERGKVERMSAYAQATRCRWQSILEYFEDAAEPASEGCGHCDNCAHPAAEEAEALRLPPPEPRFQPGDAVRVRRYGRGVVEAERPGEIEIRFPNGARRQFKPAYVRRAA